MLREIIKCFRFLLQQERNAYLDYNKIKQTFRLIFMEIEHMWNVLLVQAWPAMWILERLTVIVIIW